MALDHSKLGLENKSGRIFCFRQVYFTKSCQQIWGCVNQPFILFIHHIWGETVLWGTVFIIQTLDRMQYFTIFQDKFHSVNIQDDQSWAFSETVQKISKITYTVSQFSPLTGTKFAMNINRVALHHNKEFISLFFYLRVLKRCVILKSVWYARHFELTPASDVHERLKKKRHSD